MNKLETCYRCGKPATTREHVPPLCFFPEQKDISYIDLRKNLITVPSCEEHNLKKSQEDEFLMNCISGIVGNNVIGYLHSQTKVKRSIERKQDNYLSTILKNSEPYLIETKNGLYPILNGEPEFKRLIKCFEHIAYGLYYYEFKKQFDGECTIFLGFIKYYDEKLEKHKLVIKKLTDAELKDNTFKGENPLVFKYCFGKPDQFGLFSLKLILFEGSEIFVAFKPKGFQPPFDLAFKLINAGIKTFIQTGSNDVVEFN